jgi:hypothetical protein
MDSRALVELFPRRTDFGNNGNRLTRTTLLGTQAFTYDNLNQVIRAVYVLRAKF